MKKICLLLFAAALFLSACNTPSVHRLSAEEFQPRRNPYAVELFVGELERPHKPIAVVQSRHSFDQTEKTRQEMLRELRVLAMELGADAVMEVKMLPKRFEGMVMDERTPFPSWKPGDYRGYFLRGVAVAYVDEEQE